MTRLQIFQVLLAKLVGVECQFQLSDGSWSDSGSSVRQVYNLIIDYKVKYRIKPYV